jgi:hypothetical protein
MPESPDAEILRLLFGVIVILAILLIAALVALRRRPPAPGRTVRPRRPSLLARAGRATGLPDPNARAVVILGLVSLAGGCVGAFAVLWGTFAGSLSGRPVGLGAGVVIAALLAAPLLLWRALAEQKAANTALDNQTADLLARAVERLGAEKTVRRMTGTGPDATVIEETTIHLEARIGAILALESYARQNIDVHVRIMDILTAYIRSNAPAEDATELPEPPDYTPDDPKGWLSRFATWGDEHWQALQDVHPREDIQLALSVIGRRSAEQRAAEARWENPDPDARFVFDDPTPVFWVPPGAGGPARALVLFRKEHAAWQARRRSYRGYRIDLRHTNLRKASLGGLNFAGAWFSGAQMQGANLWNARLQGATLTKTQLQGAGFSNTGLQGASLAGAHLQGASFYRSHLQGAMLPRAHLEGTDLHEAQMQGAILNLAQLQGASLRQTQLQGVEFGRAAIDEGTVFEDASLGPMEIRFRDLSLTPSLLTALRPVLDTCFGDSSVILPADVPRPAHWPPVAIEGWEFSEEYDKWLASPAEYVYRPSATARG